MSIVKNKTRTYLTFRSLMRIKFGLPRFMRWPTRRGVARGLNRAGRGLPSCFEDLLQPVHGRCWPIVPVAGTRPPRKLFGDKLPNDAELTSLSAFERTPSVTSTAA